MSPNPDERASTREPLILRADHNGVTTLTMNMPKRLNGWTAPMMEAMQAAFRDAAADDESQVQNAKDTVCFHSDLLPLRAVR